MSPISQFGTMDGRPLLHEAGRRGDALPTLSLTSLGTVAVIAFLSALRLKLEGAIIFVEALIAIIVVQELGPLLTAILEPGRSSSAFAAEIDTMKVKEKVDVLVAMGFEPLWFLAVSKVIATVIVLPFLTLYSMLFCIVGGFMVGVYLLDFTVYTYINETMNNVTIQSGCQPDPSGGLCSGGGQYRLPAGLPGPRWGRSCKDDDHCGPSDFALSYCTDRMHLRHGFTIYKEGESSRNPVYAGE